MSNSANDSRCLAEGTMLVGRYCIQSVIGSGGFGITYVAWDTLTENHVAVKEYFPSGLANRVGNTVTLSLSGDEYKSEFTRGKQRFLSEAKDLLKFQSSPNIVNVLNFFEENSTAYMVMEFLNGYTLGQYVKQCGGCLDINVALDIMQKVMAALEEIHNVGIIHRDISPNNIMIMEDFSVKLIDFGAAKQAYCGETQNLSIVLKPGFAPPEQYANNAPQGPWTDIYALGATMYKVLTGKLPAESVSRMLSDSIIPPKQENNAIPEYLNRVILKAMAITPESRYQNIAELRRDIINGQSGLKGNTHNENNAALNNQMIDNTVLVSAYNDNVPNAPAPSFVNFDEMNPSNGYNGAMGANDYKANGNIATTKKPKKKKTGLIILIACLVLLLVGGGIFAIVNLGKDDSEKEETTDVLAENDKEDKTTENKTEESTTEKKTESTTQEQTMESLQYADCGLVLPDVNSNEMIYVYTSVGDADNIISLFKEKYPEYSSRIEVVYIDGYDYINNVSKFIDAGYQVDIVMFDVDYKDEAYEQFDFVGLESIGITEEMYADAYQFTKNIGVNDGTWKAVTAQCSPGVFVYNKAIAREVLGTDNPDEIGQMISNWDGFLAVADLMKKSGYYMLPSEDEMLVGSIAYDSTVEYYQSYMNENGYSKPGFKWDADWSNGMTDGGVFGYFGCSWFPNTMATYEGNLEWNVCIPPVPYFWGGTYMGVTETCVRNEERSRLAALLLYSMTCDEEIMKQYAINTGDCANNKRAMEYLIENKNISVPILDGQNPLPYYKYVLDMLGE